MICSAECLILAMKTCLPRCVHPSRLSHDGRTGFWGAGHMHTLNLLYTGSLELLSLTDAIY